MKTIVMIVKKGLGPAFKYSNLSQFCFHSWKNAVVTGSEYFNTLLGRQWSVSDFLGLGRDKGGDTCLKSGNETESCFCTIWA